MRRLFADTLFFAAQHDPDIFLLVGDLGYKVWDEFREKLPNQFLNCGASEQTMLDIAAGLAYAGKKPYVYSITSFLLYRPFETIRTYINHESLNVKLIGSGINIDYKIDGYSHHSEDAKDILNTQPNIIQYWPETLDDVTQDLQSMIESDQPSFIGLKR